MAPLSPKSQDRSEDSLEPVELIRQSHAILRMGTTMLAAGTASYRVKEAMRAVARALGADRTMAAVSLTEITATTHRGDIFRTEVAEVRQVTINADRIAALDRLKRDLEPGESVDGVNARLDAIEARGALYPAWANAAFAGVACAAFGLLNNARGFEILAIFVAAALGQYVRRALAHRAFNHFGQTMIAATVACLAYVGTVAGLSLLPIADLSPSAGLVSSVLFLVPGFAIVTGALDIAKIDFSAGISRSLFAVMIFFATAISLWGVTLVLGFDPAVGEPFVLSVAQEYAVWAGASAFGVLGFALMFNSPLRMALTAAGIGMVANVARLAAVDAGVAAQAATLISCLGVGVAAAVLAPRIASPIITLSVPATLIMIPGVRVYGAISNISGGVTAESLARGAEASYIVLSIVVGLVIAKLVTDETWTLERR